MGDIQSEINRISGAKTTLKEYLQTRGVVADASSRIDVLAEKLQEITSLSLTGISITTPPAKVIYTAGENFDPAEMVVTATFSNGAELIVTNYTVPTGALQAGAASVTITLAFGDMVATAKQPISVSEKKSITYTGAYTSKEITVSGVTYNQYTLTGSGTLKVEGTYENVSVWLCGGGANGGNSPSASSWADGGAGAFAASLDNQNLTGEYTVTIGASQGATSFGGLSAVTAVSGASGGTGAGAAYGSYDVTDESVHTRSGGSGDGISKYPFGDNATFKCHCAGGGGGAYYTPGTLQHFAGGKGGTNGGSGSNSAHTSSSYISGGAGGDYGGGRGGNTQVNTSVASGSSATFYGSGGGGAGCHCVPWNWSSYGTTYGGSGYQGVVYLRVPVQ